MIRTVLILKPLPGATEKVVQAFAKHGLLAFGQDNSEALTSELSVATDGSGDVLVTSTFPTAQSYQDWLDHPRRNRPETGVSDLVVEVAVGRTYEIRQLVTDKNPPPGR